MALSHGDLLESAGRVEKPLFTAARIYVVRNR